MKILREEILKKVIKKRKRQSHKGDYGRLLIIGGNRQYGGAAILASSAAVYAGSGLVTVVCDRSNHSALHARLPEAMVQDFSENFSKMQESADVVVVGCGLGLEAEGLNLLKQALCDQQEEQWLVVDGSAITLFAQDRLKLKYPEKVVFTPHEMELERLSGIKIAEQSDQKIQDFVNQGKFILVAKSHATRIFAPDQEAVQLTNGTPAQATGGMGDTLAGMIGSFLGQFKTNRFEAITAATYLHSWIAQEAAKENYVVLPSELIKAIPKAMKRFES